MCLKVNSSEGSIWVEPAELKKLVLAAQRRNSDAFAALMKAYQKGVYAIAYSTVGDWGVAEDVAQDTFVVAWTHLSKLRGAGAFPMWIRKIARNLSLNWVRSAEYRRRLAERHAQLSPTTFDNVANAADELAREDRNAALWNALQQLKPPIREALVLFYLEGRSVAEAARQLGISENALKLRLHTGRKRLRTVIEQQVEDSLERELVSRAPAASKSEIMAGLGLGPVMPQLADPGASSSFWLWLDHVYRNAPVDALGPFVKGGVLVSTKKTALAVAAAAIFVGGAYVMFFRSPGPAPEQGENWRRVPKESAQVDGMHMSAEAPAPSATSTDSSETKPDPKPVALAADDAKDESNDLAVTGDITPSAALLMTFEPAKIPDPAQYVSIEGTVVDTRGSGVSGATVQAVALGKSDRPEDTGPMLAARQNPAHQFTSVSDSGGHFVIEGIMYEGMALLSASADGYSMDGNRWIPVPIRAGDKVANVRITLDQGKGLYGRLLAPDGRPVADGVVQLVAFLSSNDSSNGNMGTTNTDSNGNFFLGFPRSGKAYLVTSSLKYGGASFDDVPVGTDDVVELQMPKAGTLVGKISRADGGAAEGVIVVLVGKANDGTGRRRVDAASIYAGKTDSGGNYEIQYIDTNQAYSVHVARADRTPLSQPEELPNFSPGQTQTWNYTIQDIITVRGMVVGETTGLPLRNVKVAALKDGKPVQNSDTPTDADGTYEMELTSGPGNYTIYPRMFRIEPDSTGYDWGKQIVLEPAQEATVDLTFIDTATISIKVVDVSGNPMEGLMLGLTEGDHTWAPVGTTPKDGRFTYGGVMPGLESNFVVFSGRERVGNSTPVVAEPGMVYPEETVVIYGSAGIEGTALKPDGTPIADGVLDVQVFYALTRQITRTVNTDSSGHFLIEHGLPATAVFIAIEGAPEATAAIESFVYESDDLMLVDGNIINLGNVMFERNESDASVDVEVNFDLEQE